MNVKAEKFGSTFEWLNGNKAAAFLSVDVDSICPMLWRERNALSEISPAELEQRFFGIRVGVSRVLRLLGDRSLKATFFVPGYIVENNPDLVQEIAFHGHEIGLHGYYHEEISGLSPVENFEVLDLSIEAIHRVTGVRPVGYRSPSWDMVSYMPQALLDRDILYDSSLMGYENPYLVDGLVELPVSWFLDDAPHFIYLNSGRDMHAPRPASEIMRAWSLSLQAAVEYSALATFTIHPWVIGRIDRIKSFEGFLDDLAVSSNIWCATGKEIASLALNKGLLKTSLKTSQGFAL